MRQLPSNSNSRKKPTNATKGKVLMHTISVHYNDDTVLVIEGFGPHTILGAVRDCLAQIYSAPHLRKPTKIEIDIHQPKHSHWDATSAATPDSLRSMAP
jgi:hypothetical protein